MDRRTLPRARRARLTSRSGEVGYGPVLLAACLWAAVAGNVGAHVLFGLEAGRGGLQAASSPVSSPGPAPDPVHDERECPLCLAHAPALTQADPFPFRLQAPLPVAHAPERVAAPIAPARRSGPARAPPHVLFS